MNAPLLSAVNISKSFGDNRVLSSVSFELARGEALSILGPSGSGKSTLLRCMNMLERPDEGAVFLDGDLMGYQAHGEGMRPLRDRHEAPQRRRLGMVFQQFNLFPHMTALENLTEGPVQVLGKSRDVSRREAMELLDRVGLSAKRDSFPAQLSGGQQQRVAIARALAMRPEALLFDEPTSALDPEMVSEVLLVIRQLVEEGMTSVIVTHEVGFAREVCDRFLFLEDGILVEDGPTAKLSPTGAASERTRAFLAKVL